MKPTELIALLQECYRDRLALVEAMPELLAEYPELIVVVVGKVYDERFTTKLAHRSGGVTAEDSRAAAVLLEGWLARERSAARAPGPIRHQAGNPDEPHPDTTAEP